MVRGFAKHDRRLVEEGPVLSRCARDRTSELTDLPDDLGRMPNVSAGLRLYMNQSSAPAAGKCCSAVGATCGLSVPLHGVVSAFRASIDEVLEWHGTLDAFSSLLEFPHEVEPAEAPDAPDCLAHDPLGHL